MAQRWKTSTSTSESRKAGRSSMQTFSGSSHKSFSQVSLVLVFRLHQPQLYSQSSIFSSASCLRNQRRLTSDSLFCTPSVRVRLRQWLRRAHCYGKTEIALNFVALWWHWAHWRRRLVFQTIKLQVCYEITEIMLSFVAFSYSSIKATSEKSIITVARVIAFLFSPIDGVPWNSRKKPVLTWATKPHKKAPEPPTYLSF